MAQARVVVVGSSNTDMVVQVARIPAPGETVLGEEVQILPGGKGGNQAVAAARLGASVCLVANIGADFFGDHSLVNFQTAGIDVSFIARDVSAPSGIALIAVDPNGENSIVVATGSNGKLSPEHVQAAEEVIAEADVVLAQLEVPVETVEETARLAKRHGARFILNPAPAVPVPESLLAMVDILTPNRNEAMALTEGCAAPDQAARDLHARTGGVIIVTLGSAGAMICDGGEPELMPAPHVKAVDSTAAGDAFAGALAVAVAEGHTIREAVTFAQKAAAISVTRLGAQPSLASLEEVERFGLAAEHHGNSL